MAFTPRHGKDGRFYISGSPAHEWTRDVGTDHTVDLADITTHNSSGDKRFLPGLRYGTATLSGLYDSAASTAHLTQQELINVLWALGASAQVMLCPEGDQIGRYATLFRGEINKSNVKAPAADAVAADVEVTANNTMYHGVSLHSSTAFTSNTTAAYTSVKWPGSTTGGGSTGGGMGQFHISQVNGSTGSIAARIQHSSDDASFADLITFTASTSTTYTSETFVSTATVKEYIRAVTTTATSTSIRWVVGFGRLLATSTAA